MVVNRARRPVGNTFFMNYDFEQRLRFYELGFEDGDALRKDIEDFFILHRPIRDCIVDCGNGNTIYCSISKKTGYPSRFFINAEGSVIKSELLFCFDEWDIPIMRKFAEIWRGHVDYLKQNNQ